MHWRKAVVLILVLALMATIGAGCQKGPKAADEQVIKYNLGVEPETLDPAKQTGIPEFNVLLQYMEGLTRIGPDGKPQPGMAESWETSEDGITWTFHLRDGVVWSNGDPVTAQDFEFAWKRALAPETAADYAYQLYYIKNGETYNAGECAAEEVGVKAIDDKTLEVQLEAAAPYFLSLTAFPTLMPVPKAVVEANESWWAEADTLIANGPFKMTVWEHNSKIEFVPNEDYWDKDALKLDKLVYYMVEEASTELTMFETGEVDYGDNPPLPEIDRLKEEGILKTTTLLGTYYYIFNCEKPPLDDVKVRKALTLAIDRKNICENVTKGGQVPALAFVPYEIPDWKDGSDFREEGGDYYEDADLEQAKKLLEEAGYPDGQGFPEIEILYNTSEGHKAIAEAIAEMWKQNLGIKNVSLTNQEWKVYLATRDEGTFQIARAGWIGDYLDPMTFLDMWVTGGGNNNTFWGDPEYDRLVGEAKRVTDPKERSKIMHDLEDILMENMPVGPIYYYVDLYVMKDHVKDVYISALGPIDFKWAWVAEH